MRPSRAARHGWLTGLFGVYLGLLAWVVLWKLEVPFVGSGAERQVKLVPFVATADAGVSAPFEVVANVLLFVPFGLYLGLLAPSTPWWKPTGAVAATSVAFETLQYVLALGRSDLTDVVANTAGGLLGLGLISLAHRRLHEETSVLMTWACAAGTLLSLVAVGLVVAFPIRYGPRPPADVLVCATPSCAAHPPDVTCRCPGPPRGAGR